MMPMVLVIARARQEGCCCDVMIYGFCGLVMLGCLDFILYLGFTSVFPLLSIFSYFGVIFVHF
jgi:hypothetical protein